MAFTSGSLRSDSLTCRPDRFTVDVSLPWMRSLPFSAITGIDIAIDGQPVDDGDTRLVVDHRRYRVDELAELTDRFWFIQERIALEVSGDHPLQPGDSVAVSVSAHLRMPYLFVGPNKPMEVTSTATKQLTAAAG